MTLNGGACVEGRDMSRPCNRLSDAQVRRSKMQTKIRIDRLLVERGLAESREKAQAMILAGEVLANEQKVDKPGREVPLDAGIRLVGQPGQFVSRGGHKLEGALDHFQIDVVDKTALDIGASTGGFTDCLLQRGARKVYAIDVGTNQLHWRIRKDPRVIAHEQLNARSLTSKAVPEPCEFFCCDVSFISATLILPAVAPLITDSGEGVVLAKPQFEVGKGQVGKGGIVRDPELHHAAVDRVRTALIEAGFGNVESMESPILGAAGNREFLLHGSRR